MSDNFFYKKNVVVTGASSGIGRELCLQIFNEGGNVFATGKDEEKLKLLELEINRIQKYDNHFYKLSANLGDTDSNFLIFDEATKLFPAIDFLFLNAGTGTDSPFILQKFDTIANCFSVNLLSPIFLTRLFLPKMISQENGTVVFTSSLAGLDGFANLSTYSSSKHGLEGFVSSLRKELSTTKLKIFLFRPGLTNTNFFYNSNSEDFRNLMVAQKSIHSPKSTVLYLLDKIKRGVEVANYKSDKYFVFLHNFIPSKYSSLLLKFTNLFNKYD